MGTEKRERQKANRAQKMAQQVVVDRKESRRRGIVGFGVVLGAVVVIAGLLWLTSGNDSKKASSATTTSSVPVSTAPPTTLPLKKLAFTYGTTACPAADGSAKRTLTFAKAPKDCLTPGKTYEATFDTTAGKVVVELDTTNTPGTVNNFVFLARNHYYDDNKIFRISPGIDILQSGSPKSQDGSDTGPGYALEDEGMMSADGSHGGYKYGPGDLVMARGSGPDSASAQFFFTTGPAASGLDSTGNYVLFGHVTTGLDVLKKIQASIKVTDQPFPGDGEPNPMVTIKSVTITEK
jgi:cyclophilin family peptidyl-prolyl cis-trans isomerase